MPLKYTIFSMHECSRIFHNTKPYHTMGPLSYEVAFKFTYARSRGTSIMALPVVEFSREGYKIRKVFALESTCPKEIIEF